jgi:catechol 2,3-dioxygenase-like lactoylglutathione lyase family enzyme/DNA-binding CsgD family transcriptional regulator
MTSPSRQRGRPRHPDILTPAEWGVLSLVQHGFSNRQIARKRGTSLDAVKYHLRNIIEKLEAGDRRGVRYWQRRTAAQPQTEDMMATSAVALHGIGQISMFVTDIERAVTFYRDTLGLPHLFTFGTLAFFDCDGVRLFLGLPEEGEWRPSSVLYFRVEDIQGTYDALTAAGVPFEGAPHLIHRHESGLEEWMAFFRDPDGNMLALMAQVPPPTSAP